jgi:O-acetylhomoserine/O-acetylserine sulfhydrylase-like pyridoxal-dependent enzyme
MHLVPVHFGITVRFVDAEKPENFAAAVDDKTRAFFCETVSNPALEAGVCTSCEFS